MGSLGIDGHASDASAFQSSSVLTDEPMLVKQKYREERNKRLQIAVNGQSIDVANSTEFAHFGADPWVEQEKDVPSLDLNTGDVSKFLIMGAGLGGLLFAARLVEKGANPRDIILVDGASNFGGSWYWNRYPGLECDIESYIYLPMLEETGYFPKHRFSKGREVREYAALLAKYAHVESRASWRTVVKKAVWRETEGLWEVSLSRNGGDSAAVGVHAGQNIVVHTQFLFLASGILNHPLLPNLTGFKNYEGPCFHSARWDYNITGGSPDDMYPQLTKLSDKNVVVLGTGATGVQIIPQVAKWAKRLYVAQRTPASIDVKNQRETDIAWAKEMMSEKGWQRKRQRNFNLHLCGTESPPEVNMCNDFTSNCATSGAIVGCDGPLLTIKDVPSYVQALHELDMPRQQRIRDRVDGVVKDLNTAAKLKSWYPTWCKRPNAQDEYLESFNQPNVHLIDISGKGSPTVSSHGLEMNGEFYPADVIIFGTGYKFFKAGSPASNANMEVIGRCGKSLHDKWLEGVGTLHGLQSNGFPNLFIASGSQGGVSPNNTFCLDTLAIHAASIISESMKKHGVEIQSATSEKMLIEPSLEAENAWVQKVIVRATRLAAASGCTPSYMNGYGTRDLLSSEEKARQARGAHWGQGQENFVEAIEAWRKDGMPGLDTKVIRRELGSHIDICANVQATASSLEV